MIKYVNRNLILRYCNLIFNYCRLLSNTMSIQNARQIHQKISFGRWRDQALNRRIDQRWDHTIEHLPSRVNIAGYCYNNNSQSTCFIGDTNAIRLVLIVMKVPRGQYESHQLTENYGQTSLFSRILSHLLSLTGAISLILFFKTIYLILL